MPGRFQCACSQNVPAHPMKTAPESPRGGHFMANEDRIRAATSGYIINRSQSPSRSITRASDRPRRPASFPPRRDLYGLFCSQIRSQHSNQQAEMVEPLGGSM